METLRSKWCHLLKSFLELDKVKIRGKCPKSKAAPCNIAILPSPSKVEGGGGGSSSLLKTVYALAYREIGNLDVSCT